MRVYIYVYTYTYVYGYISLYMKRLYNYNKRRAADVPRLLCKPVYLKVFAGQNTELTVN